MIFIRPGDLTSKGVPPYSEENFSMKLFVLFLLCMVSISVYETIAFHNIIIIFNKKALNTVFIRLSLKQLSSKTSYNLFKKIFWDRL